MKQIEDLLLCIIWERLAPENWLIVREKQDGELIILHKHTDKIRVVPASVG